MAIKKLYLLISIFVCCILAQLPFTLLDSNHSNKQQVTGIRLTETNRVLVKNAIVPLFLSEDNQMATQQLANLIQQTDIYRIQAFDTEQNLIGEALNVSAEMEMAELANEILTIEFQGELAGTALLDIKPVVTESNFFWHLAAVITKSLVITLAVFLLFWAEKLRGHFKPLSSGTKKSEDTVLEPFTDNTHLQTGESLLLYVYLKPEKTLRDNTEALSRAILSFGQKLEDHIHIYGGRILSLSEDRIVCRMPTTSNRISTLNYQQAITFCWGIACPLTFEHSGQTYRLNVSSILHKTPVIARTGSLTQAITSLTPDIESKIIEHGQGAFLTNQFLFEHTFSDFDHQTSTFHPEIQKITRVKKSLDELWKKQEEMIKRERI